MGVSAPFRFKRLPLLVQLEQKNFPPAIRHRQIDFLRRKILRLVRLPELSEVVEVRLENLD
jgi:hypothetical protein